MVMKVKMKASQIKMDMGMDMDMEKGKINRIMGTLMILSMIMDQEWAHTLDL